MSNVLQPVERVPQVPAVVPYANSERGYGRARLWLGISAVGTLVVSSVVALWFDVGTVIESLGLSVAGLVLFVVAHAVVQAPFDLLGGYFLPKWFGRAHPSWGTYLLGLGRGVAVHAGLLFLVALALLVAGTYGGIAGVVGVGVGLALVLLAGRAVVAGLMASLRFQPSRQTVDGLPVVVVESEDEGFTGGIEGVVTPARHLLPARWADVLAPEELALARQRRGLAVRTGGWQRGRLVALLFTGAGLGLAAFLVGSERLGSVGGVITLSLWFTLWSFLGLLVLPTLSRWGVQEVDQQARRLGASGEVAETLTRKLDELQDGEPERPALVEMVFHPIPSVRNRSGGEMERIPRGFWDVARTAAYVSLAGLGLLGRAVHCNCGRPALWAFLPTD